MKKIISLILIISAFSFSAFAAKTLTGAEILQKSASVLLKSGGLKASYTLKSGRFTEKGTICAKGKQFTLRSSERSIWYDGTSLWTLNPSEKEVSLTAPTVAEVAAINPYLLVSGYKSEYTARVVKGTVKGTYNVKLTPKNRQNWVKSPTLCIRSSNYMPVRVDITDRNGGKSIVIISNVKTGVSFPGSTFKYNSKAYPGVKLIDLR